MEYFKFLPEEIKLDILCRLPTESALECKLVCTTWRSLVRHPSFSKMHLHRLNHPSANSGKLGFLAMTKIVNAPGLTPKYYYFEYNGKHESASPIQGIRRISFTLPFKPYFFLGSFNGLICLSRGTSVELKTHIPVCICNPITKEYVVLPKINTDYCVQYNMGLKCTTGFGYVSSTNEYKVVVMYMHRTKFIETHIYTLGSGNGWRKLQNFSSEFTTHPWVQGVFANEALHWMDLNLEMILTFDLVMEKFCEHPPPPLPPDSSWDDNRIGVLYGFLFFAIRIGAKYYDIWLLRNKNDSDDMKDQPEEYRSMVWSKDFRIDASKNFAVTKTDGISTCSRLNYNLYVYETKVSTSKRLVDSNDRIYELFPHKNTFVSLKELGK